MPKNLLSTLGLTGQPDAQAPISSPSELPIQTPQPQATAAPQGKTLKDLTDWELVQLVENRWQEGAEIWSVIKNTYTDNLNVYKNNPAWIASIPVKKAKVRANRIFANMEAVINALIANPPKPIIVPGRDTPEAKQLASDQEKFFTRKYGDLNVKETLRKGLRNLYFGRLIVVKPFWDNSINDFNARSIDPRKIRVSPTATKELDSEYVIEEVEDQLSSVMRRFPEKAQAVAGLAGYGSNEARIIIDNPKITYKEAWVRDHVIFVYQTLVLGITRNPYWDWDGLLVTPQENEELKDLGGEQRRIKMYEIRAQQDMRAAAQNEQKEVDENGNMPTLEYGDEPITYSAYYFNHFDSPRKPYVFATAFNNENTPIGQTDMITQSVPLQEAIDRRKQDIDENASLVNGQVKVDSTVMSKSDAQKLRYEARGVIWGKGVVQGVQREMGNALPAFVFEDMKDSRNEIDNLMAASSAFRGEREGQETKGGRLALVEQSFLRLNELVQVVDFVSYETFNWFYQLAKTRYTEHHYAKDFGEQNAMQMISLIQDDFIDGSEVRVTSGKTLPEDKQFRYEQAQQDVKDGILSPVDYFTAAGYDNPLEKAKNAVVYKLNPGLAVGLSPQEMQQIAPPAPPEDKPPTITIPYDSLPPDGQVQAAAKAGLQLDPRIVVAEHMADRADQKAKTNFDNANANKDNKAAGKPVKSPIQIKK